MLDSQIENLKQGERILYAQCAANPIFQQILNKEKESLKNQLCLMSKGENETTEDFYTKYKSCQNLFFSITNLINANKRIVAQIQEERNNV